MGKEHEKEPFSDEQIAGILEQAERGVPLAQLRRQHGFSQSAYRSWRRQLAGGEGLLVAESRRLKRENAALKRRIAELRLDGKALRFVLEELEKRGR